jgi:acyl dehydratase
LLNGFVSAVLGTQLPGPGYVVYEQSMTFPNPCRVGDDVEILVEVVEARKIVVCKYVCTSINQQCVVHQGTAKLLKFKGLK